MKDSSCFQGSLTAGLDVGAVCASQGPRWPLAGDARGLEFVSWKLEGALGVLGLFQEPSSKLVSPRSSWPPPWGGGGSLPAGPLCPPPHLSSRPPQVALATFEPSWFVKAIRPFGFPALGRSPGTAKPKAKRPAPLRPGRAGDFWFAHGWALSPPLSFLASPRPLSAVPAPAPGFGFGFCHLCFVLLVSCSAGLNHCPSASDPAAAPSSPLVSRTLFLQGFCPKTGVVALTAPTGRVFAVRSSWERGPRGFQQGPWGFQQGPWGFQRVPHPHRTGWGQGKQPLRRAPSCQNPRWVLGSVERKRLPSPRGSRHDKNVS